MKIYEKFQNVDACTRIMRKHMLFIKLLFCTGARKRNKLIKRSNFIVVL